ncbi:MAG: hypothetical protein WBZ29_10230 [Methanocella sp.]
MSRAVKTLFRARHCHKLIACGMSMTDALKEAHIHRDTYIRYLPVLQEMSLREMIEHQSRQDEKGKPDTGADY